MTSSFVNGSRLAFTNVNAYSSSEMKWIRSVFKVKPCSDVFAIIWEYGLLRYRGRRAGRRAGQRLLTVGSTASLADDIVEPVAQIPVIIGNRPTGLWRAPPTSAGAVDESFRERKSVPGKTDCYRLSNFRRSHRGLINVPIYQQYVPSFFTANLRGGFVRKTDELSAVLHENAVDVACITETWLNQTVPSDVVNIAGYVMHRSDRKDGRRGGGVAVYVRHDVPCVRLSALESNNVETIWLLYRRPRMPRAVTHVIIGAVYHPPSADDSVMTTHIISCLDIVSRDHPNAGVVLLGDFNRLRDAALLSYPLRQVVKSSTRGSAVLDKIYTSLKEWYDVPVVLPNIGASDHNAVVMMAKHRPTDRGEDVTVTVRSHDSNGRALLGQAIADINWTSLYRMDTCDEMTEAFYQTVTSLVDCYLPMKSVKRHTTDKPWVTDQFRHLIRCRQHAFTTGQTARYRAYRNRVQRMTRTLRRKYYARKLDGLRDRDPRSWWRNVKLITGQADKSTHPMIGLANQLYDGDVRALADGVNRFFHGVASDLSPLDDSSIPPPPDVVPDEFIITQEQVERKLNRVKVHKAPGPDGLPNWLLRDFSSHLAGPVCAIYNASVREGFVPTRWKEANVVPVPKIQPPRAVESDLRPISLTATLVKVLESFVGPWIMERVGDSLDNRQYGALRRRSTTHALVDMLHHWHAAIDKCDSIRTVFVDFAKAFDHVDHNVLVAKLAALGLPDVIVRWICSFLRDRRQRVKIGDIQSEWLQLAAGMPQGSYLGPLTFIILINALQPGCLTHKYVDDTTMTEVLGRSAVSNMQVYVDELVQQAAEAGMIVNARKTKELLIGSVLKDQPPPVSLSGTPVESVGTFKLLGVHVASDLKWSQHIDAITSKAASRLHFLKLLKRSGAGSDDLLSFYVTVIRPVLEYACPVWHSSLTVAQTKSLESLQRSAMSIAFGDGDCTLSLTRAGLDTLQARREQLTERFFRRGVLPESSCLHYLLPAKRDVSVTDRLRHARTFEHLMCRTVKFQNSFIPYCLKHYD